MDLKFEDMPGLADAIAAAETGQQAPPAEQQDAPPTSDTPIAPPADQQQQQDVVTPPVEQAPPADAPPVAPPVAEPPVVQAQEPVERVVEKVVEKYPEFKNERSKAIYEALVNAEDPAEAQKTMHEYLREKNRDYTTMSDMDVVRAALRKENPSWTQNDVELKIRRSYGKDFTPIDLSTIDKEIDPDKYELAEQHNERVQNAIDDLRLDALQKRPVLIQQQQELELPTIKTAQQPTPQGPTAEEIEAANQKWAQTVATALPAFTSLKQTIDGKEVVYDLTAEDKQGLQERITKFNLMDFAKSMGWQNEDGSPNVLKLAQDEYFLRNREAITKSFASQIKTETTKDVLQTIKNIDDAPQSTQSTEVGSFEEAFYQAVDNRSQKN